MDTSTLTRKVKSLKQRVGKLKSYGAPMGNKNAAGPHDGHGKSIRAADKFAPGGSGSKWQGHPTYGSTPLPGEGTLPKSTVTGAINLQHVPGSKAWLTAKSSGPLHQYLDSRGVTHHGFMGTYHTGQGSDHTAYMYDHKTGELSLVSGSRLRSMKTILSPAEKATALSGK